MAKSETPWRRFWQFGEPMVWVSGGAVTVTLLIVLTLVWVVLVNGLGAFWPARIVEAHLKDGTVLAGELLQTEPMQVGEEGTRSQYKVGNRDLYGMDFRWVDDAEVERLAYPLDLVMLEREEFGNFYGRITALTLPLESGINTTAPTWEAFNQARDWVEEQEAPFEALLEEITDLNREAEDLKHILQKLDYNEVPEEDPERVEVLAQKAELDAHFGELNGKLRELSASLAAYTVTMTSAEGRSKEVPIHSIVRAIRTNDMGLFGKLGYYIARVWEMFTGQPREANTEGGLFPAIFGTVLMVMLMSLFCIPLGVVAAVYLREYAKEGWMVRVVRVAVYNLAGVPSIVYGIFGLGFFVYGIGGTIDELFFAEKLPSPTFGTGGILWASLTLALLTVPVVIVATEEALAGIPKGIREGSYSLGATQFQTLMRVLLPMATPGILTGFILAVARAAGEVAPLMITGVVKLAPALPLDGSFPFFHLDRKFMHLGFHIFDVGFQSPNVEAAKPMVYMTTLLLLGVILVLNIVAIVLRNRLRQRFRTATF